MAPGHVELSQAQDEAFDHTLDLDDLSECDSLLIGSERDTSGHGSGSVPQRIHLFAGSAVDPPEMKADSIFGSIVVAMSATFNPGIVLLPLVYQQAGWVAPTVACVVMASLSAFGATFFADAIARLPGNSQLERSVSFMRVFEEFFGSWVCCTLRVLLVLFFFTQMAASMVIGAQVFDGLLAWAWPSHMIFALRVYPDVEIVSWTAPVDPALPGPEVYEACHKANVVPFHVGQELGNGVLLLTTGYFVYGLVIAIVAAACQGNRIVHMVRFFLFTYLALEFITQFFAEGPKQNRVPAYGNQFGLMLGGIMSVYGYASSLPSWVFVKRREVSINRTVWAAALGSTITFVAWGYLGAIAYDKIQCSVLNMLASPCSAIITRLSAGLFVVGVVGVGIPFHGQMLQDVLLSSGVFGEVMSWIFAFLVPWAVAWIFYAGTSLEQVILWGCIVSSGAINLLFPLVVALKAVDVVFLKNPFASPSGSISQGSRGSGAFRVAGTSDIFDAANMRTTVRPLPKGLHRWHRLVVSVLMLGTSMIVVAAFCLALTDTQVWIGSSF